jgi:hypothetical protein
MEKGLFFGYFLDKSLVISGLYLFPSAKGNK